jgi:hypothetical protein
MPIRRFRSVEEANQPTWRTPGDPALYRAIAGLWKAGHAMNPQPFPAGVHRHRSIAELSATTEQWRAERFRAFQAAQRQRPDR